MAKDREKEVVSRWIGRISDADRAYTRWYKDFKVEKSKRYWKGFQRVGDDRIDSRNQERVTVNLILPTIAIRIPSLYYYFPYARITGNPVISSLSGSDIEARAQLLQDTANTIVRDPETGFKRETLMALKESMWAFGLVEIGHSAEFVDNPYYERPPLIENEDIKDEIKEAPKPKDPDMQDRGMSPEDLKNLEKIVQKEQFYVKHIPPEQFRVSISGQPYLEANDWCGYYEWMYVEDVKASPAYDKKATKNLKAGGLISKDFSSSTGDISTTSSTPISYINDSKDERDRDRSGQVKVWKIWDMRQKVKMVLAEGCDKFLIAGEKYKNLPLFPLTFEDQDDDWFPIPPIYPMLGPQDEYNDSREMMRGLRKVIYPRYVADGGIEPDELRKLEDGGPGVIAHVNSANPCPVQPVQQPSWDSQIVRTLAVSKDDLLQVSGVSGEARGQAEADTATQASIINQRALVRDSFSRLRVAEWLGNIIKGLVQLAIDKMSLPMWILRNCDPQSPSFIVDSANVSNLYREITLTDLKEADQLLRWNVEVDVETLSPLTEDTTRAQIQNVLTLLAQPPVALLLSKSPPLLKLALDRFGIRSAKDQEAIGQALGIVAVTPTAQGGVPSQPNTGGPSGPPGVPIAPTPQGIGGPSQQMPAPGTQGMAPPNAPQIGGPLPTVPPGSGPQQMPGR